MTDATEPHMTAEQMDKLLVGVSACECVCGIKDICGGDPLCARCEVIASITQLRTDLADMTERAEKAESEASRFESLHTRSTEALAAAREQLAEACDGLEKIIRSWSEQQMVRIARDTLARLSQTEGSK